MSLLNKIKLYFSGIIEEVNLDWKKVALEINQKLIELQIKYQEANQRIADLEKSLQSIKKRKIKNDGISLSCHYWTNCPLGISKYIR